MARFARVVVTDFPHHVTHRGNRRDDVFFPREDRDVYRSWLLGYAARYKLEIWAYSLMTNHVHLLAVPRREDSLAQAVGRTHMRHARRVNRQNAWSGHLWANRFYSTALDEAHLWAAVKYIELNPVRARLVRRAENYAWSSAAAHVFRTPDPLLHPDRPFPDLERVGGDWGAWLAEGLEQETVDKLRRDTNTGRPCGSETFLKTLESRLKRNLIPRKPGRKPKGDGNA